MLLSLWVKEDTAQWCGNVSVIVGRINAEIPVSASGVDCEAALYDESGELLQTLPLKTGDTDAFQVYCDGLGSHQFKICLLDQDTETAVFDKTVYSEMCIRDSCSLEDGCGFARLPDGFQQKRYARGECHIFC